MPYSKEHGTRQLKDNSPKKGKQKPIEYCVAPESFLTGLMPESSPNCPECQSSMKMGISSWRAEGITKDVRYQNVPCWTCTNTDCGGVLHEPSVMLKLLPEAMTLFTDPQDNPTKYALLRKIQLLRQELTH